MMERAYTKLRPPKKEIKEEPQEEPQGSTSERVIELLNKASMTNVDSVKVDKLRQVQELIVNKDPELLDNFTDEVLAFQADRSHEVRKFVIGFMEEACKRDNEILVKVMVNANLLLADPNVNVTKKLIQSMTQLFRVAVNWLSSSKPITDRHKACWTVVCGIRDHIYTLLDSENDGIRTQTVKFVEKVVLCLSEVQRESEVLRKQEGAFSLTQVPANHELLKREELKVDGEAALQKLLGFISNPAISSVNLMAAMATLTAIAKQRPQFMGMVVQAFEVLHANLPPTLAKTQVASVRKHLKMQLMNMLRHMASFQYHPQITNLLYDLGTSSSEIAKNMPKPAQRSASRKRSPDDDKGTSGVKKSKKDADDSDEEEPTTSSSPEPAPKVVINQQNVAIDITAKQLVPLLNPENVANLVLLSMVMLPDKMPDAFQASYTPIESAGTEEQIGHLARLISIQMTAMGIGSGIQKAAELAAEEDAKRKEQKKQEERTKEAKAEKQTIQTVIGGTTKPAPVEEEADKAKKNIEAMITSQAVAPGRGIQGLQRRIQGFKLESITTPLSLEMKDKIIKMAVMRVLKSEQSAISSGVHSQWQKILTSLVAQFGGDLHRSLALFILEDIRSRSSLAFAWLYEEFNIYLENSRGANDRSAQENYDACLTGLLQGIREKPETKDGLFCRLVQQAPLLTDGAIRQIKLYCEDEKRSLSGIKLVSKLLFRRPTRKMHFLRTLLDLCIYHNETIQTEAVESIKNIYNDEKMQDFIRTYAVTNLEHLSNAEPPENLPKPELAEKPEKWTEPTMKQCLSLFLALLPMDHDLISTLADVYVKTGADVKRVVLRVLEQPVSQMGMESPQLLHLVEGCPKGAETLVTRMLHILTDKAHPSMELVRRVRDLYIKRVPDVRFLIPVLNGLEKHEVLKALPKLVRLNPPVVRGVFNRLLGVHRGHGSEAPVGALTPVELLVALHNIDMNQVDVKSVIKATSLCFAEKAVYTSEVLVTVINLLVEQPEMPTLLMRTVIQSLITYPRLSGFVMNILQRLILKKVWEQEKVWEGFIRCCQRLKPQSFQVLLQLPPTQLTSVFASAPELQDPMLQYVERFTPQQRLHVNAELLAVLERKPTQVQLEQAAKESQRQNEELVIAAAAEQRAREEQQRIAEEFVRQNREKEKEEKKEKRSDDAKEGESVTKDEERSKVREERTKALEKLQKRTSAAVKEEPGTSSAFPGGTESTTPSTSSIPPSQPPPPSAVALSLGAASIPGMPVIQQPVPTPPPIVRVALPPPGIVIPTALGVPTKTLPAPQLMLNLPTIPPQAVVQTGVKREQRSPTPTLDENPDSPQQKARRTE